MGVKSPILYRGISRWITGDQSEGLSSSAELLQLQKIEGTILTIAPSIFFQLRSKPGINALNCSKPVKKLNGAILEHVTGTKQEKCGPPVQKQIYSSFYKHEQNGHLHEKIYHLKLDDNDIAYNEEQ